MIAADIGGTNARFCRATLDAAGVPTLGTVRKYLVADHAGLADCWRVFARDEAGALPDKAVLAVAGPVRDEVIKFTNSHWVLRPAHLAAELGVAQLGLVNDFEAVAHAVARLPKDNLSLLFGPDDPFPRDGAVTVVGIGTGLGVGLVAFDNGMPHIVATEGGHTDFAPLDRLEGQILDHLRGEFRRVSTERIVCGPGLNNLYKALAAITHEKIELLSDADLWTVAIDGSNSLARTALDRLCLTYGSVTGDIALVHGPRHVVLVGGLTQRLQDYLVNESGFHSRFTAKGRYEALMRTIPIRLANHPEIGLYGAAAAYRETMNDRR
nr:glucokinase [Sphingobium nicotianae]